MHYPLHRANLFPKVSHYIFGQEPLSLPMQRGISLPGPVDRPGRRELLLIERVRSLSYRYQIPFLNQLMNMISMNTNWFCPIGFLILKAFPMNTNHHLWLTRLLNPPLTSQSPPANQQLGLVALALLQLVLLHRPDLHPRTRPPTSCITGTLDQL